MSLDEFITESRQDVERFRLHWLKQHDAKPEHFPTEMNPGDWFDQFITFLSNGSESA